jgi:fatty-acyl-CoA synthase
MGEASGAARSPAATPARDWMRAIAAAGRAAEDPTRIFPVVIGELGARFGARPALASDRETLSFAALAARMNRYARWALARGVRPGVAVGLLMPNRPDYLAIWLGVTQVGGVVALLNTNLTGAALAHCIAAAAPRLVIVAAEFAPAYDEAAAHLALRPEVWLDGESASPGARLDLAIGDFDGAELAGAERVAVSHDDRALLIYTSGTTGLAKAANVSHRRIMAWTHWFAALADMGADDRMYDCLPMHHSVGGIVAIGAPLVNGGSVVVEERFSAQRFWDRVARWDCTLFQYIGELCRYLAAAPPHPLERAHRLRLACGNGLGADVWRRFQGRFAIPRILEFYAATEGNFSLYNVEGRVGAIGRIPEFLGLRKPVALVRFDPDAGLPARGADGFCIPCAVDEPGEAIGRIGADPAARFEGYAGGADDEPKILRDVFAPGDAYLRSGDLMRIDGDGFYHFVDRLGDTFRWKGENVATLEVAAALRGCPGVDDAVVYGVGVPGADGRAAMALLTVAGELDLAALALGVRALPTYARPVFLRVTREPEFTATFKHRKRHLAEQGFDPDRIAEPLYLLDRTRDSYVALDRATFERIIGGAIRL